MQGDFNNNLQTQDKSALPQTNPLENPSASFFSKYKLTISLIATMIIIAVLVTLYFLVILQYQDLLHMLP